jgi:hypothetical protein
MITLFQDLRYSARQLIKNPGFTLTALISLALGIGAATAVFSVIYAVLMNPYPYPAADRIVRLTTQSVAGSGDPVSLNSAQIQTLRKSPVVESVLAMDYQELILTGQDLPENVDTVSLTSNSFQDLGAPPHPRARTLGLRRGGRPGPSACCCSFLPILAETLLVQPRHSGPHAPTRSQQL